MTIIDNKNSKTTVLALCGLFTAITAICSYINIPLGFTPVPMNLATLSAFLAGGLLGKKYGSVSMAVYVLMGAAGLPVFAGFQSGLSTIAGPTGGFLLGYIAAAFLIGLLLERGVHTGLCICAMTAGLIICYMLGLLWFMFITGTGLLPALMACVIPFIPGDIIKIAAAVFLLRRLRPAISAAH